MESRRDRSNSKDTQDSFGYRQPDSQAISMDDQQDDSEYIRMLEVLENIEGFRDYQQLMEALKQFDLNLLTTEQLDLVQKLVNNIASQL